MKKIIGLLLLLPVFCRAMTNQLEFNYGRGTPRGSFQWGDIINQEGPRGPEWSADFLHKMSDYEYIGLGGGHFHSGDDVSQTFAPNMSSDIYIKTTSIMALGRIDLSPNPKFTPYLLVGAGWIRNSLYVTSGSQILADDSVNTLGYEAGIGVDLALTDRLFIGIETKYQGAAKHTFDVTPAGQAATGESQVTVPVGAYMLGAKVGVKY